MKDAGAFALLHNFLKIANSEEIVQLFVACNPVLTNHWAKLYPTRTAMMDDIRRIYGEFVAQNSPNEVNVSAHLKSKLKRSIKEFDVDRAIIQVGG